MRKLLFTLVAMIVTAFAFNISAETTTVYVVGSGDGLGWDLPGKAYTGEDGVVSFTVNNLTKFKASTKNATEWDGDDGYNAGSYGPGATAFGSSVYPNGQTLPMVAWGEDIDLPWTGNYTITMDFNNNQITAKTSTPQPTTAPDVYIRGGMNGWAGTPAAWKFTNVSWTGTSGEWTFTGTIPAGQEFKIADSSWGAVNYTLNNTNLTPTLDSPYNAAYNGGNTKLATAFTGTVTLKITNYSGHVATITFSEGNGGTVTPSYPSKLYIIGTINSDGWNPANVAAMTSNDEGVYTIESVTLGENGGSCGFAITGGGTSWDDVNGLRYGPAVKDTKAVVGVNKVDGVGDVSWTIDPGTYKMVFDYDAMTLTITQVSGEVTPPTPTYPEKVYIIGTIDGEGWNPTLGKLMTDEGEGIYTIEDVVLSEVSGNTGFAFVTALAENNDDGGWTYINGLRYGPKINDTEATLDQELPFEKVANSWTIKPGTYNFTLDFNDMILYVEGEAAGTEPDPDVELVPFDAMFNFGSYEGMAECVPGLPAESSWTADGTTGNFYYTVTKAVVDGVTVEPKAHASATVSNTPRCYKTTSNGTYNLRVYNNNTMTISAPEGGFLTSIAFTTNTTNSTISKTTVDTGVLAFDGKNFTWSPTARANTSSITLSFGGTIQIVAIEVTGEAPEVDEPDVPTPEVPETTWEVNGSYNDDSSWSTPIKFTSYDNGVYSTDKINKLVTFKLTNEGTWYGYEGTGYAEVGKTFKVASGDQYGNVEFGLSGYVEDAVISFNPTTLEVTVTGTWVSTALELYVMGAINDWSANDDYKLASTDGNVYTITLDELTAGSEFKIAASNWSPEYTTNNKAMENGTYTLTGGGNMALGKSMTNVTLTLDREKNTLTIAGTESGATTLYLYGSMNDWKQSDAWKFETEDGENYTLEGVTIPAEAQMKISDAGWNSNFTYSYTGEGGIVPNTKYTLQNLTGDNENMYMSTEVTDATINYNINTHEFEIVVEYDIPDAWYLYTEANWGKGTEMVRQEETTDKGEYVYKVTFPELSAPVSFKIFPNEEGQGEPAYGAGTNGTFNGTDVTLEAVLNGGNFANWTLLKDATFTFYYNPAGQSWLQLQGTEVVPSVLYVKGDYDEWKGNIQLTRTSDELTENGEYTFSASVEALDGEFKISQFKDNWNGLNYGGQGLGENPNSTLQANGATLEAWYSSDVNFTADKLENVTINFYYNPDKEKASWLNAVTETPAAPEFFTVVFGTDNMNFPAYNAEGTKLLPTEADPNIYEGIVEVSKNITMAFFTDTEVPYTGTTSLSGHLTINMKTYPNWPSTAAQIAQAKLLSNEGLEANQQIKMYVTNFGLEYPTNAKEGDVKISINWAEQSFSLELMPYVEKAPNAMYLWGSVNGGETITNMATLEKAANADVYTLENYVVPACGIFDTSDENVTVDRGFSFYISDNATSKTGGTIYMAPMGASDINLTEADDTYSETANNNKTGSSFLVLNPGVYNFTFDYNSLEFTAELVTPYKQVQFDIVGGENITNPRQYVTAMSMGEEPETLKFSTNSKLFSYDESTGVLFALNPDYQADYTLTVTGPTGIDQSGDTYVIAESDANGMKGTMLGLYGINNGTFTITVAEKVKDLQLTFVGVNFNIEGEDINDLLTIQDQGALISSGGADTGMINITSNPFNFVPNMEMGAYMLNLTHKEGYLLTASVAPATPDDAQIVVQDGDGNVMIQGRDLGDNIGVIVTITKETEPGVLYLAQPFNTIPAVDPQSIEETEPGVYEGVFKFKTGMSYIGFYTVDGDVITKYSKGAFGTFPSDPNEYPLTEELVKDANTAFSWYIPSLPAGCQGNFNVTVNTNDLTITVDPIFEEAPAPENLYLWGSTNGGVRAVNMAGFVKNGNVYTLEDYEISSYGIFDTSDSEGGATIDRGFSFFLCDNGTSFTAGGASRYYGPKATSEDEPNPAIIDLTTANNTYTATATKNGTVDMGGNFIAINPGVYTLTFNYETKEFKAVLDEAYKQVTFEFVGEGNIADPRTYVEAINMSAAEPETLELYTNTKLFSYNDPAGVLFALKEGFSEDYTLTVTGPTGIEAGETTYMITGSTTEGIVNEMVTLIGVDNVTFTITVGEIVDNNAYLGIAQGQVPTAPDKEYALTPDATGYVYTGTFTIQPGQSFNFWYPSNILLGDENEDGENVKYQPMGPASGEEILINFNSVHNIFEDGVDVNMTGYWTLDSDQPLELTVTVDMTTRSIEVLNNTELPALNALVFDDWTMYLKQEETTAEVPLYLDVEEAFDYQGVQFLFTLPEGIEFKGIEFNDAIEMDGAPAVNTDDKLYGAPNTTSVLAYFQEGTNITEDIATITVASKTGDIEAGTYDVDLKVVIFSNVGGNKDIVLPDYTGKVTIEFAEIPATAVEIESVTLNEPSYTSSTENVTEVTQGESVDVTVVVTPENSTDVVKVTADNGATVTKNEDGTWTVDTSGVEVTEGEEVTVTITATAREGVEDTYTITVKGIILGDSNANGKVTVADVVTTANYIVEKPINNFCWPNANVITNDEDAPGARNGISVQDVTATVNIVLDTFDGNRNPQNIRRQANRVVSNDRLVASNFKAGQNVIAVDLENNAQYSAIQATIELPAGMKVDHVAVGTRAANHDLVYNVTGNELHVVLFSYDNSCFTNGEGSLFNITVKADENSDDLVIKNILASDAVSNGYELSFDGGLYSETTGIDGIGAGEEGVRYFTVDGIEVFNPEKGQILIRVQGNEATKVLVK